MPEAEPMVIEDIGDMANGNEITRVANESEISHLHGGKIVKEGKRSFKK